LGRIVEEKGVEFLVAGFRQLADPEARLLLAGDHLNVAGGSVIDRVRAAAKGDPRIRILGFVPEERLADFYASLDVFAFPSVNSLEAFGIAQVEAMLAGVPVIASDLPGVRIPVRETGFGVLVPPADADAIHRAIAEVARDHFAPGAAARVSSMYSTQSTIDGYAALFAEMGVTASGQPRGSPEGDAGQHH
jgi:glycosyltransferase involved in cell wall biosynthesis